MSLTGREKMEEHTYQLRTAQKPDPTTETTPQTHLMLQAPAPPHPSNLLNLTQQQLMQITIDSSDGGASEFYLDINENGSDVAGSHLKPRLGENPTESMIMSRREKEEENYSENEESSDEDHEGFHDTAFAEHRLGDPNLMERANSNDFNNQQ